MKRLPQLTEKFEAILAEAQKQRPQRNKMVGGELEWIVYERQVMFKAANSWRKVSMEQIMKAERSACGHSDYSHKFALYCAEIVLEERRH